ncbi:hypothetical protein HY636_01030 [Candidatus Woesearchaeota archaeon]|nr:hypothetical protein [Candidatus Woesearchaeota archaeon]
MEFKQLVKKIELSEEFREFKKKEPKAYLVHVFQMTNANTNIGYYSTESQKVFTFEDTGNEIRMEEQPAFQEIQHDLKELKLSKVAFDSDKAIEIALGIQKEKYAREIINQNILILQHLDIGLVFNITFITAAFNTLNIKINAETGEVIEDSLARLVGW